MLISSLSSMRMLRRERFGDGDLVLCQEIAPGTKSDAGTGEPGDVDAIVEVAFETAQRMTSRDWNLVWWFALKTVD